MTQSPTRLAANRAEAYRRLQLQPHRLLHECEEVDDGPRISHTTPPNPDGPPPSDSDEKQESASSVGDMFEEGETDIGPHPSLIDLENWEPSELASSAETGARETGAEENTSSE